MSDVDGDKLCFKSAVDQYACMQVTYRRDRSVSRKAEYMPDNVIGKTLETRVPVNVGHDVPPCWRVVVLILVGLPTSQSELKYGVDERTSSVET
jgi:hypothetical protein